MKNLLTLTLIFASLSILITSCNKDCDDNGTTVKSCAELSCLNGGTKVEYTDGTCGCDCNDRFTGQDCSTDLCEDLTCPNGFLYYDDQEFTCECECDYYYTGANCDQTFASLWEGTYQVTDNCTGNTYTVTITSAGSDPREVVLNNMGNLGINVPGTADNISQIQFSIYDGTNNMSGNISENSGIFTFYYQNNSQNCQGSMVAQ